MKLSLVFSAVDRLTGPVGKMLKSVATLGNITRVGERLRAAGDSAAVAGGAVDYAAGRMRAGIAAALQPMMEQEDAAAALSTVMVPTMGSVADATERARKSAIAWSEQHSQSAADFLNAAYQMSSAGLAEEQAIAGTKAALTLAKGALGDNIAAANLLAVVYNTMGDKAADVQGEMTRLSDVLAKTQQQFQLSNLQQLGEGLKYGVPAAQMARLNIVQLSAAVGQLNSSGLQGSMAGTALAQVLSKMSSASKDLGFSVMRTADGEMDLVRTLKHITDLYGPLSTATTAAMYDAEKSTGKLTTKMIDVQEAFREAFGDEGLRAIALLTNNVNALEAGFAGVQNSTGAAATAAELLEATTSSALAKMRNQIDNTTAEIGTQLMPTLEALQPTVINVLERFKSWVQAHPALAALAAKVLVIGTAIMSLLGPAMMFFGMFTSGIGRTIQAVATMGKAYSWLKAKWAEGFPVLAKLRGHIVSVGTALWGMAKKAIAAGVAFMSTPVGWLTAALIGLAAAIAYVALKWEDLTGQTNRFVQVGPEMANRLKSDAKFKQQMVAEAMGGNTAKQAILSSVFKDEFDRDLWDRTNFEQKQRKREALLQEHGMGLQPAMPDGANLVNVPTFSGKPAGAIDKSVRIDRIEIHNSEPMDEDELTRLLGRRLSEAVTATGG
ncbi:MAG: phage tail tape measure protein [Myxococcales bacterium]|nr:phage tail tape measure protein [Myxococcales bacterium]